MATVKKINTEFENSGVSNVKKTHANDPFFVKKVSEAKLAVKRLTLPDIKQK